MDTLENIKSKNFCSARDTTKERKRQAMEWEMISVAH